MSLHTFAITSFCTFAITRYWLVSVTFRFLMCWYDVRGPRGTVARPEAYCCCIFTACCCM